MAELTIITLKHWSQEGEDVLQKPRGTYAPYRIRNRTGTPLFIWTDLDHTSTSEGEMTKILDNQTVEWRFDDWKTMREVCLCWLHGAPIS